MPGPPSMESEWDVWTLGSLAALEWSSFDDVVARVVLVLVRLYC